MADCQQACVSAPAKRKRLTSAEKMRNLRARRKLLDPNFQQKENLRLKAVKANTVNAMTNLELAEYKKKVKRSICFVQKHSPRYHYLFLQFLYTEAKKCTYNEELS